MTNPVYIVYICYGNLIRSPAAKEMTMQLAERNGLEVIVDSVGINAKEDHCMDEEIRHALKGLGIKKPQNFAKRATRELLEPADYIFCMGKKQVEDVLKMIPEKRGAVYTLPGFVGYEDREILDPSNRIIKEPYKKKIRIPLIPILEKIMFMSPESPNGTRAKLLSALGNFMARRMGYIYYRDEKGVKEVFRDSALEIRMYVNLALAKIFGDKYEKSDI